MSMIQAPRHSFLPQPSCEEEESLPVEESAWWNTLSGRTPTRSKNTPVAGTHTVILTEMCKRYPGPLPRPCLVGAGTYVMIIVCTELHISIFRRKRAEHSATLAVVIVALWSTHVVEQTLSCLPHWLLPAVATVHNRRP